ncbi:hypothetical protein QTP70_011272 [Hemibagrus guttatus]|uniref:Alkylated DNA repair protein AlkB homologue 8 N-terminal domain-containing protein n=1 Tax=Hemibagrus guttatus TaxID=175788 RepID=A0AAE0R8V0_9TELE|nr:hypothetical protein QTP70_011272 [Hemibagrus guttatus]
MSDSPRNRFLPNDSFEAMKKKKKKKKKKKGQDTPEPCVKILGWMVLQRGVLLPHTFKVPRVNVWSCKSLWWEEDVWTLRTVLQVSHTSHNQKKFTTLKRLVDTAGPEFKDTRAVADELGLRSLRRTEDIIQRWTNKLSEDELNLIKEYHDGAETPDKGDPFPELELLPDLNGYEGLLKFADDTTVICLIQDGDESAYRQEVEQLAAWCSLSHLELNTLKTVEMIVDFRRNTPALPPLTIMNSTVPTVASFRFLGTTISQDLKWDTHIDSIIKKAQERLYFLRQLRKFNLPQELLTHFYSAVIESVLCTSITVWFGSATKSDMRRLQRTIRTAERIIGAPLSTLQELYTSRETRWKGSKARSIGAGFKLFYYGVDSKRNGVGVVLKEEFVRNVLEVKRVSDRVMSLKLEIEGVMLNVVSGYAPQVGCELEEKERFWSELDEVMESIPTGERVVIGADFNGHVGEGNTGDEEVMGKFGVKERNLEGQMVVDFAKWMDMAVVNTREGQKDLYRLARQRDRDGKDVQQVRVIKDRDGRVLTSEESVQRRWKEYFEELMNEENEREKRVEGVNSVEQKVDKIRKDEVRKALKRMKSGKAVGPDDIPVEVWKCLGEAAVEFLTSLFNRVLESERMPEEWRGSVLVPIFKNKGDVQSCSNYRGIKLMSHTMKLWERVVEARLRKVVEICEQQYGFMPRKSTTDAIFALRILMEKYRDGQRELHCVFVDL